MAAPPNDLLRDQFNALEAAQSPSCQELKDLAQKIDCVHVQSGQQETRTNDVHDVRLALYLSSPLSQVLGHQSTSHREHQLRALIGALALSQQNSASTLNVKPFDELRKNIADRFYDVVNSRRESQQSLVDYNQWFLNLFLIRLAWQYFRLYFRRGQPLIESIVTPVVGLALSGASVVSLNKGDYCNIS